MTSKNGSHITGLYLKQITNEKTARFYYHLPDSAIQLSTSYWTCIPRVICRKIKTITIETERLYAVTSVNSKN